MKPSRALVTAVGIWILLVAVPVAIVGAGVPWLIVGIALLCSAAIDALLIVWLPGGVEDVRIERYHEEIVPVARATTGTITIHSMTGKPPRWMTVFEQLVATVQATPYPVRIARKDWASTGAHTGTLQRSVEIVPHQRGSFTCRGCVIEYPSRLGLWVRKKSYPYEWTIRVYPDFWEPSGYGEESIHGLTETAGFQRVRRRGEGTEFRELRDFVSGDSIRHVDWRASSRHDHLIVKAFQEEQDQQILMILDGGYRLHQIEGESLQFEYALKAMLRLAAVSIGRQDSVGAYIFGREERYLAPAKGSAQYRSLLRGLYDYQSSPAATSPGVALERCLERLRRRTFLLLITNLRSEDQELINWVLPLIKGRHRLMIVTLREQGARGPDTVDTLDDALMYGSAIRYQHDRERLWRTWNGQGILTLDCEPAQLSARLVNRYLALKAQGAM